MLKLSLFWLFTLSYLVISISAFGQKKNEINANSSQLATIHRDTILIKLKEYLTQIKLLIYCYYDGSIEKVFVDQK